ncbi:hypothetical protein KDA06_02795 [Candidatus Saccharibacteria bacterium]|jgi:uncharacterized membrane protein|nr:hypothetical protein [Candidatus Saccharibacteria bacterium]HPR09602.1 hypothetical protein [Candidatus Saccharibacteria bacterium]
MNKLTLYRQDFALAQTALFVAICLQIVTWANNGNLSFGPHPLIILSEIALAAILGMMALHPTLPKRGTYRTASFSLLGLITIENIISIVLVLRQLISNASSLSGYQLLGSAVAIFLTNIIVFALWYWEIDSPGLTGKRWSRHDRDFLFLQHDKPHDYPGWQPNFVDYLYHSVTNAINFAPADTRPITRQAKLLMGAQALVSVTTLALIIARSVSILGQ